MLHVILGVGAKQHPTRSDGSGPGLGPLAGLISLRPIEMPRGWVREGLSCTLTTILHLNRVNLTRAATFLPRSSVEFTKM